MIDFIHPNWYVSSVVGGLFALPNNYCQSIDYEKMALTPAFVGPFPLFHPNVECCIVDLQCPSTHPRRCR
jgi:hypothetical protein